MQLIEKISQDLNLPPEMLDEAIIDARRLVKHIKIKKRNGTDRTIYQPSKKLKIIQYWLINNIFKELKIHPAATGYIKGGSIKANALRHRENRYLLKLDITDFFPSINFADFKPIIETWHTEKKSQIIKDDLLRAVRLSCFYKKDSLPIGYPTSPIISNVVMYDIDTEIMAKLSNSEMFGVASYTRYADDMTFSTDTKGACKEIKRLIRNTLQNTKSPKLMLNDSKTSFVSSSGGSAIVTGLRICHDGHLTIHKKYKDHVRLLISLFGKNKLAREEIASLKGHLANLKYVDGAYYTKLQKKHFEIIKKIYEP